MLQSVLDNMRMHNFGQVAFENELVYISPASIGGVDFFSIGIPHLLSAARTGCDLGWQKL